MEKDFKREVHALETINRRSNSHIITLLATFKYRDTFNMIFPCAESDLFEYWKRNPSPSTAADLDWTARQILGIAAALDAIHNPGGGLVGRHGDIKPSNILWIRSNTDQMGILAISDFGSSTWNREVSRSDIPARHAIFSPTYRPPETDRKYGMLSRASDIWSMGCLLLDMVCWMLGGFSEVVNFGTARLSHGMHNIEEDAFFDVHQQGFTQASRQLGVFKVKEQVKEV